MALFQSVVKNIKFKYKIVLLTSVLLYAFVICTGLLIFIEASRILEQQSHEAMQLQLKSINGNIEGEISNYERIVQTMLIDASFQELLGSKYFGADSLEARQAITKYMESLIATTIVPPTWEIILKSDNGLTYDEQIIRASDVERELWYQTLLLDKRNLIHWSYYEDSIVKYGTLICTTGIMNKQTQTIPAYIKLSISFSSIIPILQAAAESGAISVFALDSEGRLIWSSDWEQNDIYLHGLAEKPTDLNGYYTSMVRNETRKFYYENNVDLGFSIVCIPNLSIDTAKFIDFNQYFLIVISAVIIISLIPLLLSANLMTKRLSALNNKVRLIDENTLIFVNDINGSDELAELSRAFEDIINRVRALLEKNKMMEQDRFDLELKALQSQINPHFLFNTLSAINSLANEIQADNISEVINALAEFYRISLSNGDSIIKVQDELKILSHYIKICRIRYRNRLNVNVEVDSTVSEYYMPKLILQPFIENSAFHGFSQNTIEYPMINLKITSHAGTIVFSILDNGRGIEPQKVVEILRGESFAISNIDKRIKILYGEEYGVKIASVIGKGTTVTIVIPIVKG